MAQPLNWRELLINSGTAGVDNLVDEVLATPDKFPLTRIKEIKNSKLRRQYLEACLLICKEESDYSRASEILEIPVEIIKFYEQILYNVSRLSKIEKLETITYAEKDDFGIKTWALSQGFEFIEWRLGKNIDINPVEGLSGLFSMSLMKAKEALFNSNNTDSSRESAKWVKLSFEIAKVIKAWKVDGNSAKLDIVLALREIDPDFSGSEDLFKDD